MEVQLNQCGRRYVEEQHRRGPDKRGRSTGEKDIGRETNWQSCEIFRDELTSFVQKLARSVISDGVDATKSVTMNAEVRSTSSKRVTARAEQAFRVPRRSNSLTRSHPKCKFRLLPRHPFAPTTKREGIFNLVFSSITFWLKDLSCGLEIVSTNSPFVVIWLLACFGSASIPVHALLLNQRQKAQHLRRGNHES